MVACWICMYCHIFLCAKIKVTKVDPKSWKMYQGMAIFLSETEEGDLLLANLAKIQYCALNQLNYVSKIYVHVL